MSAQCPLRGTQPHTARRRATAHLRRLAAALTALICALLASAAIVPSAWAMIPNHGGISGPPVQAPAVVTGGMAAWQITLIAVGAAAVAATAAVLLDRARAARQATSAAVR